MRCLILCVLGLFLNLPGSNAIAKYYMERICGTTLDMSKKGVHSVRLKLTSRSYYYSNTDCNLLVNTTHEQRLMIHFRSKDIQYSSGCNKDFLEVHDGSNQGTPYVMGIGTKLCGSSTPPGVYTTTNQSLWLLFKSGSSKLLSSYTGFDMIITGFHTGSCLNWEYKCDNGRCIDQSLTCNGFNPCGDQSDCPLTGGAIAGIVIGCVIFVAFVTVLLVILRRRRRRRRFARGLVVQSTNRVQAPPPVNYGTQGTGYDATGGYNAPNAGYNPQNAGPNPPNAGYNPQNAGYNQPAQQTYPYATAPPNPPPAYK